MRVSYSRIGDSLEDIKQMTSSDLSSKMSQWLFCEIWVGQDQSKEMG